VLDELDWDVYRPRPGGCCARPATPTWPTRRRHHPRGVEALRDQSSVESVHGRGVGSSTNPRESQPEGRRLTSQSGHHYHETLG
jgi:hypothetical protein